MKKNRSDMNLGVKKIRLYLVVLLSVVCAGSSVLAREEVVSSPDGHLKVTLHLKNGSPYYCVTYKGVTVLEDSPLGLVTSVGDFSKDLQWTGRKERTIDETYALDRSKFSRVHYTARELVYSLADAEKNPMDIIFRVSNHDIAFRYHLPQTGETACLTVEKEMTGFDFPAHTTTFLSPQATPMTGWKRTKPSYEEEYVPDEPVGTPSKYKLGYTFPGLFHVGDTHWVLVSETGVHSTYCASRLSEGTRAGLYTIAFPSPDENGGIGSAEPSIALPGETPWRTLTVGDNLKPIVETTIPFDVVAPLYEPTMPYRYGRSTWSWILWQDGSINYEDQVKFIDLASDMGYEYTLVDNYWDDNIGRDRMEELARYAATKGVSLFLWYNSNGYWSDAPQGPKQRMNTASARKNEMKWLKSIGVKGLKVDFFGGDKQETMKLYEDILADANEYGLMVIFHGCTLPRGWERMFPNYISSEAVLASENLIFNQHFDDQEAYNATLHPFIRNAVGSMDFGGVLLNKRHNRTNDGGTIRRTTDVFQLATAVLFQSAVQNFAITPNNLEDTDPLVIEFMKNVPTVWDETRLIDGYPGRYCVLARRHDDRWYIGAVNAEKEMLKVEVDLSMLAGKEVSLYEDKADGSPIGRKITVDGKKKHTLTIRPNGGCVIF